MKNIIPIFPLNLVVYPYSRIPLHIFEERYKKMIRECLQLKTGFGIISIIGKTHSEIGSYVEITRVLNKYENGEMDIVVKGTNRFRVIETSQHPDGYMTGKVEEYSDISKEFDQSLLDQLKNNFVAILSKINFKLEDAFWENYKNSELKSYKIAEKSGLSIEQQQELLTLQKENERLDYLLSHLDQLEKKLKDNIATSAIVMRDGYIN